MQGSHAGAGPLNLMSCVRESSPMDDYETDTEKHVVSKRKFWNPKKWFRKKQKTSDEGHTQDFRHNLQDQDGGSRSRSTSELSVDEERRDDERRHSSSMHPGLSVSHDSVFHPLNSGSSDLELDGAQSSSSLSISQPLGDAKLQSELSSRLRLRRGRGDTSEDDEGLPGSPLCGSPAAANDSYLILEKTAIKDLPTKSHSTCSDGSLLSMDDSSELDEDSIGVQSRHSSKISLHEKRIETESSSLELGPVSLQQLNHSAAHHRVSVRPKRTYGAPRRKKGQHSSALPATPEVNEEASVRSSSPEVISREQLTQLYSSTTLSTTSTSTINSNLATPRSENKLKTSSLPAGVSLPVSESFRPNKTKLQADHGRSQDDASFHHEEKEEKLSFFERIFPRRSGKSKKKEEKIDGIVAREDKTVHISLTFGHQASSKSYSHSTSTQVRVEHVKPTVAPRTGAASRQRVQPIDIPIISRDTRDGEEDVIILEKPSSPEKSLFGSSPIQAELENILKQRMSHQKPSSPLLGTPPISPRSPQRRIPLSKVEQYSYASRPEKSRIAINPLDTQFGIRLHNQEHKTSPNENISDESKLENIQSKPFGVSLHHQEIMKSSKEQLNSIDISDIPFKSKFHHEESKTSINQFSKSNETTNKTIFEELKQKHLGNSDEFTMSNQISSTTVHRDIQKSSLEELNPISHSEIKRTFNEDFRNKVKLGGLSSLQQKVLSLNEDDQDNRFQSLTDFSLKSIKPVTKSHSFKSKLEEKSSIESEDDIFDKRKSLKAASLDSIKNLEELPSLKNFIDENKLVNKPAIESNKVAPEVLKTKNLSPNFITKVTPSDAITISGPSHTAIVSITSSKDTESAKTTSEFEDATKKIIKESNVSITKIHLKHEETQVTRTSVTIPKQEVPEFLNMHLNKVEAKPITNVIFSMKSPKLENKADSKEQDEFDFKRNEETVTVENIETPKIIESETKFVKPKATEMKPKPLFLRASKENEKPGKIVKTLDVDKSESFGNIGSNNKENAVESKFVENSGLKTSSREIKFVRTNSKENIINGKIGIDMIDDKPLMRPKTLFNFPPTPQETIQKSSFLRNTSKEDTSPKENPPHRPKTLFNFQNNELELSKPVIVRSISKESANLESPKDLSPKTPPFVSVTPLTPTSGLKYIKNEVKPPARKSSIINSCNPDLNKSKSISLDSLRSNNVESDKSLSSQDSLDKIEKNRNDSVIFRNSSQDSLDKLDKKSPTDSVILRRKSLHKQKDEDQPELMKVFARRSLKLKDEDIAVLQEALSEQKLLDSKSKSIDCDKENTGDQSDTKEQSNKDENIDTKKSLLEIKRTSEYVKNVTNEASEVQLRRPFNHNIFLNQRAQSLNPPKNIETDAVLRKQTSLKDNRKTDNWITVKRTEEKFERHGTEIIENLEDTKSETKTISQRKAEWEKRFQQFNK